MSTPSDKDTDVMSQLLECVVAIMTSRFETGSIERESFMDDLLSSEGVVQRKPHGKRTSEERFMFSSLELLGAHDALRKMPDLRKKVMAMRYEELSDRLFLAQSLSWDRIYVLRERFRRFVDAVRRSDGLNGAKLHAIEDTMRQYKKDTDALVRLRGQHVHTADFHHPLVRQLGTLELLERAPEDASFKAVMSVLRKTAAIRAKKAIQMETTRSEEEMEAFTTTALTSVLGSLDGQLAFDPLFRIKIANASTLSLV
jgi:hypothetical protein